MAGPVVSIFVATVPNIHLNRFWLSVTIWYNGARWEEASASSSNRSRMDFYDQSGTQLGRRFTAAELLLSHWLSSEMKCAALRSTAIV